MLFCGGQGLWLVPCTHLFLHVASLYTEGEREGEGKGEGTGLDPSCIQGSDCLQPETANPEPARAWFPEATPCAWITYWGEANEDGMCDFKTAGKHYRSKVEIKLRAIGMHKPRCFQSVSPSSLHHAPCGQNVSGRAGVDTGAQEGTFVKAGLQRLSEATEAV